MQTKQPGTLELGQCGLSLSRWKETRDWSWESVHGGSPVLFSTATGSAFSL
jgi:hypothetical protein